MVGLSDRGRGGSWDDPLDDIDFEEFELRDPGEGWEVTNELPARPSMESFQACPSCGASQNASNRHCEQCGARLGQRRIAVATPPIRSVSAGGRALGIIVVVIAVVVVAALIIQAIRGDDEPLESADPDETSTESTTATTAQALGPLEQITPISITCSSEYNANLGCENLIDGEDTYWNDASLKGEDAWIKVSFVNPVALESVQIVNVANEEKFRRNHRIRAVEIETDDLPGVPFVSEIDNANDRPLSVSTPTNHTLEIDIRVTATYTSESLGGNQAFDELAVQELRFWGRVQETRAPETTSTTG